MGNNEASTHHQSGLDLNNLHDKYITILHECNYVEAPLDDAQFEDVVNKLITACEWTSESAIELVDLVRTRGAFFLRNAAALAIAMGIEDGSHGR